MGLFRPLFFFALAFFAAVALFIGSVTLLTSLSNGAISISYVQDGKPIAETVQRAVDSSRFWRTVGLWAGLPLVLGAGVMWFAVGKLRG